MSAEYNRSIPGALRNALDWMSRPYGSNPLGNKPTIIAAASGSPYGTAMAQNDLRSQLAYFNAYLMTRPELYISA